MMRVKYSHKPLKKLSDLMFNVDNTQLAIY